MEVYARVRQAVHVDGMSIRRVAREFGLARKTIRKMLQFSVPPGYERKKPVQRPKGPEADIGYTGSPCTPSRPRCPSICCRFSVPTQTSFRRQGKSGGRAKIADIGEQVAPLRGKQVDQIQPLRLTFQHRRRWRKEVHVGVSRHPTLGPKVHEPGDFQGQFALAKLDVQAPRQSRIQNLWRAPHHFADRQLHLKRPVYVREGRVHQLHVPAVVLKPAVIDFRAMAVRRNVAAVL